MRRVFQLLLFYFCEKFGPCQYAKAVEIRRIFREDSYTRLNCTRASLDKVDIMGIGKKAFGL